MLAISLQSGSNGNCIYIETLGVKLLIDAGISGIQAERRLAVHGRRIRDVDGVLISHEHGDHIRSAGIFNRKYGLPIYLTRATLFAATRRSTLGRIDQLRHFVSGESLRFGGVTVETVRTPHDGVDGVAFVVDDGTQRLGILTDLGHNFPGLTRILCSLDGVFLESNYDPKMLEYGAYPWPLKRRISGPRGHLSNEEAAHLLAQTSAFGRLQWACLAHLSENNNTPKKALETHREIVGKRFPIHLASRYDVGRPLVLETLSGGRAHQQ